MSYNKKLLQQITERLNKPSKPKVPRNQWQHPGEVTSIPSRFITMKGVTYPVLGVGADGYTQLMQPGMDYAFPEAPVVEYPMMQVGGPAPLYVSDKNDPRLRAYNDSLELYKWNPKLYASGKKHLGTNNWFEGSRLAFDNVKNYDELIKKPFTKSDKATHLEFTKGYPIVSKKGNIAIRVTGNSDYPESMNQFPTHPRIAPVSGATEHLSWIAHQYKKPVQPVIYRRPQPSGPVSLNTTVKMDPIAAPVLPQLSPRTFTPNYANKTRAVDFWNPSMKGGVQGGWHRRLFNSMEEADNFMKYIRENNLSAGYDVTNSGVNTDADRIAYEDGGQNPIPLIPFVRNNVAESTRRPQIRIPLSQSVLDANKIAVNKREAERRQKILNDRRARLANADKAYNEFQLTHKNLADRTQAAGDRFRVFPNDPESFFDDYINPGVTIGNLAAGLGRIPLNLQEGNYGEAAFNFFAPALAGVADVSFRPRVSPGGIKKALTPDPLMVNATKEVVRSDYGIDDKFQKLALLYGMDVANKVAPLALKFPPARKAYKDLAYKVASRTGGKPLVDKNPLSTLKEDANYTGVFGSQLFDNRDLLKLYIYGDDATFVNKNLKPIGLQKYQDRYGDLNVYQMISDVPDGAPYRTTRLDLLDFFNQPNFKKLKSEGRLSKAVHGPNESLVEPIDDVGGHMVYLVQNQKSRPKLVTQDIWKFTPEDYIQRWGNDLNDSAPQEYRRALVHRQAQLMDKAGKPFVLAQENPVYFNDAIVPKGKSGVVKLDPSKKEEIAKKMEQLKLQYLQGNTSNNNTPTNFNDKSIQFFNLEYGGDVNQFDKGGQHGGLDRWFAEKWVDVKTGEECGRQEGDDRSYPACRPSKRINDDTPKTASELSSAERQKFIRSKTSSERINYQHRRKEYGGELNDSDMANKPNNPSLWSKAKALAKEKYDVYPSAYANGWAAKWYKSNGGTWSKAAYGMQVPQMQQGGEPDGAMALGQIDAAIDKLMTLRKFIQPDSDLEPWVSSKLTLMDHYTDAVSDYMQYNPEAQGMMPEQEQMMMEEGGGIPERYKNMGFSRVGQKKESTSEGKKWMVLAKKGDDYKVVHGGYDGMQDYTQHGNEQRRENFWNRMGGRDSAKAQDPFSPLYWHKRFGTWEEGGEIPQMKKGGSTWAGNTWFGYGGRYLPQFQTLGATDTLPTYKTVDNSEITSRFSDMVQQQQPTNAAPPFRPGAQTAGAITPAAIPVAPPQGPIADSAAYAKALEMVDSALTRGDSVFASNVDKGLSSGTMTPEEAFTQTPMTPGEVFWRTAPYLALGAIAGKTLYNRANKKQAAAEGVEQAGKLNPEILDDYIKIIKQRGYREPDDFKNLLKLTTMGEDGVMRNVTPQEANEILAGYSFNKNKTTSAPARKLNVLTQEMVKVDGWQNYGFQNAEQADDWINNLDNVAKRKLMGLKNAGKTQEFNQAIGELIAQNAPTPVTPSAQPTVTPSADGTPKDPKAVARGKKGQEAIQKISEEFPEFEEFYEKQRERQRLIDQKKIEIVEANKKLKKTPTNSVLKGQVTRANNKIKELESITQLEKEKMKVIQKIRNESNAYNRGILEKQLAEIDQAYNAKLKIKTPSTPVGAVDDILYRSPLTAGAPAPVGPVPITNFDDFDINPRIDQRDILGEKKYNMRWDEAARRYRASEDPSHAKLMEIQFNRASNLINQRQPTPSMLEKFRASDIAENLRDAIRFAEESGDLRFLRKILSIKEQGGQLPMAQVGKNVVFATSSPITGYGYSGQTVVGNNEGEIPTFLKFLDPTGVTSWGDAYETWNNPEANAWDKFGAALSVIPMVGKAGKIMKAADYARKSSLLGKATRAGRVALNALDNTLSYPARVMDKVSPLQKAYEAGTGQMISNWGPRAKSAARWAGLANQGNRGVYGYNMMADGVKDLLGYESSTPQKKAGGGINIDPSKKGTFKAQASRMGMSVQEAASKILSAPVGKYSPEMRKKANFAKNFAKEYGGPVAGEVMDVSPEELEMLRQQGYEFEIL